MRRLDRLRCPPRNVFTKPASGTSSTAPMANGTIALRTAGTVDSMQRRGGVASPRDQPRGSIGTHQALEIDQFLLRAGGVAEAAAQYFRHLAGALLQRSAFARAAQLRAIAHLVAGRR